MQERPILSKLGRQHLAPSHPTRPNHCPRRTRPLPSLPSEIVLCYVVETRQVFDLSVLQFEVTEHHAMQAVCRCGHVHTAGLPAGVNATVQYGPRAQAALMGDRFGLPVSQATVLNHLDSLNCADRQSPNYNSRKYQAEVRELRDLYEPILRQAELDDPVAPQLASEAAPSKARPPI